MKRNLQVFYTIFSAIILSAGIPNEFYHLGAPLLGFISLIPFYFAISSARTYRQAGFLTALHFALVQLFSSFWLAFFKDFAIFTLGGPILWYIINGSIIGRFLHVLFSSPCCTEGEQFLQETNFRGGMPVVRRIIGFAAVWTLWEWSKSIGFIAYPWGTLIITAYRWPLMTQFTDITGTWGISFLFAFFAACCGEGIRLLSFTRNRLHPAIAAAYVRTACFLFVCIISVTVYGAVQYTKVRTPEKYVDAVIVQQNTDPWETGDNLLGVRISQKLTTTAIASARTAATNSADSADSAKTIQFKPDVVCWSESVLNYAFPSAMLHYEANPPEYPLIPFIDKIDASFVIGAPVLVNREKGQYSNAAVVFDKNGNMQGFYGKRQLVPFAEYVPLSEYEWFRKIMKTLVGFSDGWTPGTTSTVFDLPLKTGDTARFSTPVCFEDAFPWVCRDLYNNGSDFFINITNNSWSKTKSAEYQHFAIASYRAIELRTTLVRATNSGYSVVIDPCGRILADMPLFTEDAKAVTVPVYAHTGTFYSRFGNWFVYLLLAFCLFYYILFCRRFYRSYYVERKTKQ